MKDLIKTRRPYSSPAVLNSSQFERRGILAACCQRPSQGSPDCASVFYENRGDSPSEQVCSNQEALSAETTTGTVSSS